MHIKFLVYTDGACSGNPGPGGWGVVLVNQTQKHVVEMGGHAAESTNNQMEMTAVGKTLRYLTDILTSDQYPPKANFDVTICTDSKYVIQGIEEWLPNWLRNNFRTSAGKPVKNEVFWKRLHQLMEQLRTHRCKVEFKYVPGHSGVALNERADKIAQAYSKKQKITLFEGTTSDFTAVTGIKLPTT